MTKRIALYFDGTWNSADQAFPTNVTKLYQATKEGESNGKTKSFYMTKGSALKESGWNGFLAGFQAEGWRRISLRDTKS
jgi:uncharacterized protein (DUF2235 family)